MIKNADSNERKQIAREFMFKFSDVIESSDEEFLMVLYNRLGAVDKAEFEDMLVRKHLHIFLMDEFEETHDDKDVSDMFTSNDIKQLVLREIGVHVSNYNVKRAMDRFYSIKGLNKWILKLKKG